MKIVLWGINYHPETTGIAPFNQELAEYLADHGHTVKVVTGFCYYPHWRKSPEDAGRWYRTDSIRGVQVHRCWQYVPRVATALRRIVHELSFGLTSLLRVLSLPRAEVYVVVSPPLILGFFAWIATRLKASRYVFHVQDLQPDAAVGLGMVRNGPFIRALYALERFAYARAAAVSGISDGMMAAFERKGVEEERRIYFPNWLRGEVSVSSRRGAFRARHGVPDEALLAVYSGNLGKKQGIDILFAAAERLHRQSAGDPVARQVRIFIIGAGAGREEVERRVRELDLPNLRFLPLLSDEDYAAMLMDADVGLVTQVAGTGQFFFPSKVLSLLRARLPVLAVADAGSELDVAASRGGFGVVVPPGRADLIAYALWWMSADPHWRGQLAARTRWVHRYDSELVLPRFVQRLEELLPEKARPAYPELATPRDVTRS